MDKNPRVHPDEFKELNEFIALHVYGKPRPTGFDVSWEYSFTRYLDGDPIREGAWYIGHIYGEGDEQQWIALPFATNEQYAINAISKLDCDKYYWYIARTADCKFLVEVRDRKSGGTLSAQISDSVAFAIARALRDVYS